MPAEKPFNKLRSAIRESLRRSGVGARRLESELGLKPWSLRGILDPRRPQVPSVDRAFEICQALGLEFYIGPPRDDASPHGPGASTWSDAEFPRWAERLRNEMRRDLTEILDRSNEPVSADKFLSSTLHELSAGASGGTGVVEESVAGYVAFTRRWLARHALFPPLCTIISVKGDSMEPTLPHGSYVLVDRHSAEPRHGRLYAVRTDEELMIRRLQEDARGERWLISDNPAWKPAPWPDRAEVFGEVKWAGKLL